MPPHDTTAASLPGLASLPGAAGVKDWSRTALGAPGSWPPPLRGAAALCLASQFPLAVVWGPEFIYVYNEAASGLFGSKHPWALGQRVVDVWPEAMETVGPLLESVYRSGEAVRRDDQPMMLAPDGSLQEIYLTFSYSPILGAGGAVEGVLVAFMDSSARVVEERRQRTMTELASAVAHGRASDDLLSRVREVLARNSRDLPFTVLLESGPEGELAPGFCTGLHAGELQPGAADGLAKLLAGCIESGQSCVLDWEAVSSLVGACGPWPEPPRQVLALAFRLGGHDAPAGVLLAGASPRRPLDAGYRAFFEQLSSHVAHAVAIAAFDAAERARAAAMSLALHRASGLLAAVFDRAPGGIALSDAQGAIFRANAAYAALVGVDAATLAGRKLDEWIEPGDMRLLRARRAGLEHGTYESFETEVRYRCPDGRRLWVSHFVSMIGHDWNGAPCFVTMARDISARKRSEVESEAARRELGAMYKLLQSVRENERKALAREVHDQLGQTLSAAKIDIKLLEDDLRDEARVVGRAAILRELGSASKTIEQAIGLVRKIATELRAPEVDEFGLYAAIAWQMRDFERRTRMACHVSFPEARPHPARAAAAALLRIYQEASTNVLRHAQAKTVWVSLERRGDWLVLRVRDDGVGMARSELRRRASLGLQGMRERAELVGGRLMAGPLVPQGFLVSARVPLPVRKGNA